MTNNKITRKELFNALLKMEEVKKNPLYVEKLEAELVAIDKKNANRKPTAQQIENEDIKKEILQVLADSGEGLTITDIMKKTVYDFRSNQQCTALVNQLKADNLVARTEIKGRAYYSLVEEA